MTFSRINHNFHIFTRDSKYLTLIVLNLKKSQFSEYTIHEKIAIRLRKVGGHRGYLYRIKGNSEHSTFLNIFPKFQQLEKDRALTV